MSNNIAFNCTTNKCTEKPVFASFISSILILIMFIICAMIDATAATYSNNTIKKQLSDFSISSSKGIQIVTPLNGIKCTITRISKEIVIDGNNITMLESDGFENDRISRAIASLKSIRTKNFNNSLTKFFNFEGKSYTLHIEDVDFPSDADDYLIIKSNDSHEILYPATCKL